MKKKKQKKDHERHEKLKKRVGRRWLVVGGIGLLIAAVPAAYRIWTGLQSRVVIENRSGQAIESATVSIRGDRVEFGRVANGRTVDAPLHITADTSVKLEAQLADGTMVRLQGGYLTDGMTGERPRFVIRPGGQIEFEP